MALDDYDVMGALSDPILQRMDFFVDSMHVRGEAYQKILGLIKDEQILVVQGTDPHEARYEPLTDTIVTQNVRPPADLLNRSMLIHECTHAIKDMEHVIITALGNEAAAYLAQAVYLLLSNPKQSLGPGWEVVQLAVTLAKQFDLDKDPGIRKRIAYDDIIPLIRKISKHPAYLKDQGRLSIADGISQKAVQHLHLDEPPEQPPIPIRAKDDSFVRIPGDILFDFDKFNLKPTADPVLRKAATAILQSASATRRLSRVIISGHTDSVGSEGYNLNLSKQRAESVARWFSLHGYLPRSVMGVEGFGKSQPIPGASAAENRRVEIYVINK